MNFCEFFDFVKSFVTIPTPATPKEQKSLPVIAYSPFGVYHLQHGKPWKGYAYLTTQTITATASLGLLVYLNSNNTFNEGDLDRQSQLETLVLIQRGSTVVFYGLWFTSILEARQHFDVKMRQTDDGSTMVPYFEWGATF